MKYLIRKLNQFIEAKEMRLLIVFLVSLIFASGIVYLISIEFAVIGVLVIFGFFFCENWIDEGK